MHVPYIGNGEKAPFYFGREANPQSATMLRNDAQVGRKVQDEQSVWFHLYGIQSTTHQIARVSRRVFSESFLPNMHRTMQVPNLKPPPSEDLHNISPPVHNRLSPPSTTEHYCTDHIQPHRTREEISHRQSSTQALSQHRV